LNSGRWTARGPWALSNPFIMLFYVILENQGVHFGYKSKEDEESIKHRFLEGYYPSSRPWRSKAIMDARKTLLQAVKKYQETVG
jgi:hypothetical protein